MTSFSALGRETSRARQKLGQQTALLSRAWQNALRLRSETLERHAQLLRSLGYRQVLARGFALVRDAAGHPQRMAAQIQGATRLDIEFADGHIQAVSAGAAPPSGEPAPPKRSRAKPKLAQASLFE